MQRWGPPPAQPFIPPPKQGPDFRSVMQIVMVCLSMPCLGLVVYFIATHELEKRRVGPSPRYAIAKVPYYADANAATESPKLVVLGPATPLVELPRELETYDMSDVDGPFLESESIPEGTKVYWKTRICTLSTSRALDVNCRGFPADEADEPPSAGH